MVHTPTTHHRELAMLPPLGILVLLSPFIVILTAAILVGLLGIFVTWLLVVGFLFAAIVAFDVAHRSMRHFSRPPVGALRRSAVG